MYGLTPLGTVHTAISVVTAAIGNLAASMSHYLIDRIDATPNIELRPYAELTQLHGSLSEGLTGVSWRDNRTGPRRNGPSARYSSLSVPIPRRIAPTPRDFR